MVKRDYSKKKAIGIWVNCSVCKKRDVKKAYSFEENNTIKFICEECANKLEGGNNGKKTNKRK